MNIFFVGQIEFNAILLEDNNRALRQRITVTCEIPPLALEEVGTYLRYRLRVAGASRILFSADAMKQIHLFSQGYPRLINVIADRALLTGFVNEAYEIGPQIVLECARELQIRAPKPSLKKSESVPSPAVGMPPQQQQDSIDPVPKKAAAAKSGPREVPVRGRGPGTVGRKGPVRQDLAASTGTRKAAEGKEPARENFIRSSWRAVLLLLFLLLAVAAGVFWYLYPVQTGKYLDESGGTISSLVEKQDRIPLVPERENAQETMGGSDAAGGSTPGNSIERQITTVEKIGDTAPPQKNIAAVSPEPQKETGPEDLDRQEAGPLAREERENVLSAVTKKTEEALDPIFLRQIFTIGFDHNSNSLSVYGATVLDRLAAHLAILPYRSVVIRGYTDATGSEEYNKNLSLFRASIVKGYLMAKGLKPETMVIKGLGSADPVAGNVTREGQRKNRRVEIEVLQ
jgi:general secretion pathway protein A